MGKEAVDTLTRIMEQAGLSEGDFQVIAREEGWIAVRCGEVTRHYPLNQETDVLISGDIRRGAFG